MFQTPTPTPTLSQVSTLTGVFAQIRADLLDTAPRLITAAMVFGIFFIVAQIGRRIIAYTAPRVRADTGAVLLLSRIYYYSVLIFGLITALGTAGLNVSALVAGLGLTGFALGFALKDVLSNLVSGLMLLVYRPFKIGDQIEMGAYEGTIKTIRMRDTIVRSYDGRMIIIPNTKLITEVVINNSAARLVRDAVAFELTTATDIEVAREVFVRAMIANASVGGRVEPLVIVRKSSSSSSSGDRRGATQLEGRFWYNPRETDKVAVRNEVARAVEQAFDEAGIGATLLPPTPASSRPPVDDDETPEAVAAPAAHTRVSAEAE